MGRPTGIVAASKVCMAHAPRMLPAIAHLPGAEMHSLNTCRDALCHLCHAPAGQGPSAHRAAAVCLP